MVKVINKVARIVIFLGYFLIACYSMALMGSLLIQARDTYDIVCALLTDILWTIALFIGAVVVYSITFPKKKKQWD